VVAGVLIPISLTTLRIEPPVYRAMPTWPASLSPVAAAMLGTLALPAADNAAEMAATVAPIVPSVWMLIAVVWSLRRQPWSASGRAVGWLPRR
jgi:hypothetical protein